MTPTLTQMRELKLSLKAGIQGSSALVDLRTLNLQIFVLERSHPQKKNQKRENN